jgi:hypothetical protein
VDVYGFCPNGHSSSAIDEESVRNHSDSDGGYSIGRRRGDRAKVSTATSRSFDRDPNVTDASDPQSEKQICRALQQMQEYELLSSHSPKMQIVQFVAISSPIQM